MAIKTKRIYQSAAAADGYRILVDRLWPRGLTKDAADIDRWMKEVAPSDALRSCESGFIPMRRNGTSLKRAMRQSWKIRKH